MKNIKILLSAAIVALFLLPSYGQLKVVADGKVGIGTATPGRTLEVAGQLLINNFNTYPSTKQANFLMRHGTDPVTHFNFFIADTDATNNTVGFGGGAGGQYAATAIQFWSATNNTTIQGTERMRVNGAGRVRIGNTGTISHQLTVTTGDASKPGGGVWIAFSDERVKQGVRPYTDGLSQVLQIEPVFFQYKPNLGFDSGREFVGIIAQDMQKVAPYTIEDTPTTPELGEERIPGLPESLLSYNGTAVTYMLVNAIKEQQAMINEKESRIEDLEARITRIEEALAFNNGTLANTNNNTNITLEGVDGAYLKQNAPNPFGENTSIEYSLPKNFNTAYIQIYNAQGAMMRKVDLPKTEGIGVLNIKARELAAGDYVYTLVVDGKVIDTKKMVLSTN